MKRFICLLLVLILTTSTITPALAYEDANSSSASKLRGSQTLATSTTSSFLSNGHGEYQLVIPAENNPSMYSTSTENSISATSTEDTDIYHVAGDQYLTHSHDNLYLLTTKIEIDPNNCDYLELIEKYQVPQKTIEEIKAVSVAQAAFGNDIFSVEIYVPFFRNTSNSNESIAPLADEKLGYSYVNHTYGNKQYRIRNYMTKFSNVSPEMESILGSSASSTAKTFINLLISFAGVFSKSISVFGAGLSAYDYLNSLGDSVITGDSQDKIEFAIVYDRILKNTDVYEMGMWSPAMTTHKVWLNRFDMRVFSGATGKSFFPQPSINSVIYSPHFNDYDFAVVMAPLDYFDPYPEATFFNRLHVLNGT